MGREATVQCRWAEEVGICKVLLETHDLIVRRALRHRVPIAQLRNVSLVNEELRFYVGGDAVSFWLGSGLAQRWAKAIATPPPSLANKLGISRTSRLQLLGEIESQELKVAIAEAATTNSRATDLILASVKTLTISNSPWRGSRKAKRNFLRYGSSTQKGLSIASAKRWFERLYAGADSSTPRLYRSRPSSPPFVLSGVAIEKLHRSSPLMHRAAWSLMYLLASGESACPID